MLANVHKYGTIYNGGGIPSSFLKTVEPKMAYTLERSGRFFVEVRDVTSRYGGPDYEYRLLVRTPIPHVGAFDVDPVERINLVPGIARKLSIVTHQEEGFAGEVLFACSNLPPGVRVFPGADVEKKSSASVSKQEESFLPGIQKTTLVLLAEPDAPVTRMPEWIRITARPVVGGRVGADLPVLEVPLMVVAPADPESNSGGRGLPIVVMKVRVSDWITSQWNRCGRRPGPILCSTVIVVSSVLVCAMAALEAPAPSHSPTLLALRLVPEQAHLRGPEAARRFVVMGTFADGLERDLTSDSRLRISDPELARVGDAGRVVALAPGEVTLRARIGGREAQSRIRIDPGAAQRPFRFDRDIASILTKRGCNASECHGSVKGKGGLKLSLDALYPEEDHEWIVKGGIYQVLVMESGGPRVPRVNPERPEESLLLQKAAMQVIHGGGERLGADSADYAALLDWIREGAEYGDRNEAGRIVRVTVFPQESVLDGKGVQQLLVTAYGPDGRGEDISHQARYVSQNPHVVTVDENGRVTAAGRGETTVLVRTAGHAVSARFGVVDASAPVDFRIEPRNLIDKHVFAKLRKFQIRPSALSSDSEFLRRVCMDITGTLPPPDRVPGIPGRPRPAETGQTHRDSPGLSPVRGTIGVSCSGTCSG